MDAFYTSPRDRTRSILSFGWFANFSSEQSSGWIPDHFARARAMRILVSQSLRTRRRARAVAHGRNQRHVQVVGPAFRSLDKVTRIVRLACRRSFRGMSAISRKSDVASECCNNLRKRKEPLPVGDLGRANNIGEVENSMEASWQLHRSE